MFTMSLFIKSFFIFGMTLFCALAALIMRGLQKLFFGRRCR